MSEFIAVLYNPAMMHAAAVHLPIALAILGAPLLVLAVVLGDRTRAVRLMTVGCYLLLAVSAIATVQTGLQANHALPMEAELIPQEVRDRVHTHEEAAEKVWLFGAGTAVLAAVGLSGIRWLRTTANVLGIAAALATAGWVAYTGHQGGMLVYAHGLGTPALECRRELLALSARPPDTPAPPEETPTPPAVEPAPEPLTPQALDPTPEVALLLEQHCVSCHHAGPNPSSGLDLTSPAAIQRGGRKAGAAVIAGRPGDSPLLKYVLGEYTPRMPINADPLSDEAVEALRAWIAAGAGSGAEGTL